MFIVKTTITHHNNYIHSSQSKLGGIITYVNIITTQPLYIQSYDYTALVKRKYYVCIRLAIFQVSSGISIVTKNKGNRLA